MQRITCKKCGAAAFASETFCPLCGDVLARQADAPPTPQGRGSVSAPAPLRFPLTGNLAAWVQRNVPAEEEILFSLENEEHTTALVGTSQRLLVLRGDPLIGGWEGVNVKAYPYASIADVRYTLGPLNTKIQLHVYTYLGKPEVGRRARLGQITVENFAPFDSDKAVKVCETLREWAATARAMTEE
ncbi:MAG: hypothetical protein NZT92_07295 [Abditibacteriales bacterium]|nr:hypothetical protein [Abditibacteriales bacterium]MDW8365789.1 hypothetical protein [Abditibacteriales bacterium]